jgi:hypothetical protein
MRLPSHETRFDFANSLHPARYRDSAYQALAIVEDYKDREIVTIYDPEQSQGSPRSLPGSCESHGRSTIHFGSARLLSLPAPKRA